MSFPGEDVARRMSLVDERVDSQEDPNIAENAVDTVLSNASTSTIPNDFTCAICMELLYSPMTLLCQHSFCRECIRGMKDAHKCPTCNGVFPYPAEYNRVLDGALSRMFPETYEMRKARGEEIVKAKSTEHKIREEIYRAVLGSAVADAMEDSRDGDASEDEDYDDDDESSYDRHQHQHQSHQSHSFDVYELAVPPSITENDVEDFLKGGIGYKHLYRYGGGVVITIAGCGLLKYFGYEKSALSIGFMASLVSAVTCGYSAYTYHKFNNLSMKILHRKTPRRVSDPPRIPVSLPPQLLASLLMMGPPSRSQN